MGLKYSKCPKCGHSAPDAGALLEEQCPACGVIFRKFLAAHAKSVAPDEDDRAGARLLAWLTSLIEPPEEDRKARAVAGAVLLVAGAWYAWQYLRFDVSDPESMPLAFLYGAMVPFHEFGHLLFSPFGEFLHVAGGSLMQFLMPLGFGIYFVHWRRDNLAGWLMLWWEGMQWVSLAPYCYDAKTPNMVLLTGRTGDTGGHDYIDLLGDLGLLNRAHEAAAAMKTFGVLLMLAALLWGGLLLARTWREHAANP
ncbi:MAG: hypothetical protein A3I63_07020 [Betaproteobacteria bacterium RIFCSPLOWO2_02_FULL_66_14]|nr:MAG: hypothetical protein A3I63_07020 [Betaproteobacteria bacterium RIFCSPLOWO2_02_FULL_66_14]